MGIVRVGIPKYKPEVEQTPDMPRTFKVLKPQPLILRKIDMSKCCPIATKYQERVSRVINSDRKVSSKDEAVRLLFK